MVEINEYKLIGTTSNRLVNTLKQLGILGFYKQLTEKCKIMCVNIDKEFLEYIELNKKELQCRIIEKFKDGLTVLKKISEKIEKMEIIREPEVE